jgi:glycerophosphoryl diester phosphodiesterase
MLLIELKCGPEIIVPLARLLAASTVQANQLRLLAFDYQLIARLKEQLPGYQVCLNVDYHWRWSTHSWRPSAAEILAVMGQSGADGISCRVNPQLDLSFMAELRQRGKEVYVWTVDLARSAVHYRALGVDGIMTNRPGWLRKKLLPASGTMANEGGIW